MWPQVLATCVENFHVRNYVKLYIKAYVLIFYILGFLPFIHRILITKLPFCDNHVHMYSIQGEKDTYCRFFFSSAIDDTRKNDKITSRWIFIQYQRCMGFFPPLRKKEREKSVRVIYCMVKVCVCVCKLVGRKMLD